MSLVGRVEYSLFDEDDLQPCRKPAEHKLYQMIHEPPHSLVQLLNYDLSRMGESRKGELFGDLGKNLVSNIPHFDAHSNATLGFEFTEDIGARLQTIESTEDWMQQFDQEEVAPITDIQVFSTYFVQDGTIDVKLHHDAPVRTFDFLAPTFPVSRRQTSEGAPFQLSTHINYYEQLVWELDRIDTAIRRVLDDQTAVNSEFYPRFLFPLVVSANAHIDIKNGAC